MVKFCNNQWQRYEPCKLTEYTAWSVSYGNAVCGRAKLKMGDQMLASILEVSSLL